MVPKIAAKGHSFKGALAYYLHDKNAQTAERVEWAETRNMGGASVETGRRIMIATASRADDLKRESGAALTGRKNGKPVMAFSIAWHPDEAGQIDRAEMLKAAESALIAMGAQDHQAIIVCHRDEAHPHVHIVLNRVHPETGIMLSDSNERRTLSAWALAYREARGEALKYCPQRAKNRDEREKLKQSPERKPAPANERAAVSDQAKAWSAAAERPKSEGSTLKAKAETVKARHQQERGDAWTAFKAKRDQTWSERPSFKAIARQHRDDTRPAWSVFGRRQASERREFRKYERSIFGSFLNAVRIVEAGGLTSDQKGYLSAIFRHWAMTPQERVKAFDAQQAKEKADFAARMNADLSRKIDAAKATHGAKLDRVNTDYTTAKAIMSARHASERADMKREWQAYFDRREQAAQRMAAKPYHKAMLIIGQRPDGSLIRVPKASVPPRKIEAARTETARAYAEAAKPAAPPKLRRAWGEKPARSAQEKPRSRDLDRDFEPER